MKKTLYLTLAAGILAGCESLDRIDGHAMVLGDTIYSTYRPAPKPVVKPAPAPAPVAKPQPAPAPAPVAKPQPAKVEIPMPEKPILPVQSAEPKRDYAVMPGQNRGLKVRR
ncbi:MAG: hypothetical protein Q4F30_02625 [Akkermansia sp.]|nr:hypothetical protein [Akkermansia sp.]